MTTPTHIADLVPDPANRLSQQGRPDAVHALLVVLRQAEKQAMKRG